MNESLEYSPVSKERRIEKLYKTASIELFGHIELDDEEKEKLQFLNQAYGTSRAKVYSIKRNDGSDTFDHLLRTSYAVLEKSRNPTLLKLLIAMNHDNLEDTDIDFNGLKNQYGKSSIALGVYLISKKPFYEFIEYSEKEGSSYQIFEEIKNAGIDYNTGILNGKNILSDYFMHRKQNHYKKYGKEKKNRLTLEQYNNLTIKAKEKNIHPDEWEAYDKYILLEKKYKEIRNETYFKHMINLKTFYKYALKKVKNLKLRISDEKVKHILLEALEVKYWDRIDNLKTSEIYTEYNEENRKKANRKIEETEKYFYEISKETHPYIHVLIKQEVERLRTYVIVEDMQKTEVEVNDILIKFI